jgi:hypothetical protein
MEFLRVILVISWYTYWVIMGRHGLVRVVRVIL